MAKFNRFLIRFLVFIVNCLDSGEARDEKGLEIGPHEADGEDRIGSGSRPEGTGPRAEGPQDVKDAISSDARYSGHPEIDIAVETTWAPKR